MTNILIDGKNLVFRAYFAHKELTHKGNHTGAYHGILSTLIALKLAYSDSRFTWNWEGSLEKLWRRRVLDPTYKDHRGTSTPSDAQQFIREQKTELATFLSSLGIPWLEHSELEADDLIGLGTRLSSQEWHNTLIVSTDRDFYQLLTPASTHPFVRITNKQLVTSNEVLSQYGVPPSRWLVYRSLTGDSSDKLPGLKGCGPQTALEMLTYNPDPREPWENQPHALRLQYKRYQQHWPGAMLSYSISKLPKSVASLPILGDKTEVVDMLKKRVVANKGIWLHYCNHYGLVAHRDRFEMLT